MSDAAAADVLPLRECPNCHRESPVLVHCRCSLGVRLLHEHYRCPACCIHVQTIPVILYGGDDSWVWRVEQPAQDVAATAWAVP